MQDFQLEQPGESPAASHEDGVHFGCASADPAEFGPRRNSVGDRVEGHRRQPIDQRFERAACDRAAGSLRMIWTAGD